LLEELTRATLQDTRIVSPSMGVTNRPGSELPDCAVSPAGATETKEGKE
jgi:hypothetical protein